MTTLPPTASRYWLSFGWRLLLTAGLLYPLIGFNSRYFFHADLYESGDMAANTLSVLRAEHFQELYGPYSQWGFHHPGPALFCGEAAGEGIFFRWLHLTPTPFNAQVLATLILTVSFFAAAVSVAVRWVRGVVFVVLALALAALHFTAADPRLTFFSAWSAYVIPLIFLCLLVTAASVGAGQGEDLPLLVLSGCFLIHLHVAQPLFVLPMFVVAFSGLAWSCWRRRRTPAVSTGLPAVNLAKASDPTPPTPVAPPPERSALPWRVYRRSFCLASGVAAIFALPILLDLLFPHGNFQLILQHLRDFKGENHPWSTSLRYFLQFAVYKPALPGGNDIFAEPVPRDGWRLFGAHHPLMLGLWSLALLSPLLPLAVRLWRGEDPVLLGDTTPKPPMAVSSDPARRWRFLGWLWGVWCLSVGLTLYWGRIQDGPLYYHNAAFNQTIWYVLALLAAGSVVDALDTFVARSEHPWRWKSGLIGVCTLLAVLTVTRHPDRYRVNDADDPESRAQARTVIDALATEPAGTPHGKLLLFPHDGWGSATGIAALLARRGEPVYVVPEWRIMFGDNHVLPDWSTIIAQPADTNPRFEVWHVVPEAALGAGESPRPLLGGYALVPGGLPLDPAKNPSIDWLGSQPNFEHYIGSGWESTGPHPAAFTMSVDPEAVIQFRAVPVPDGSSVRTTFRLKPFLPNGKRDAQRLVVHYNGHDLGTLQVKADEAEIPAVTIPSSVWNRYASGLLVLGFPDAISEKEAGIGGDIRPFAFRMEQIRFALTGASTDQRAVPIPAPVTEPTTAPAEVPAVPAAAAPPVETTPTPTATPAFSPGPAATPTSEPSSAAEGTPEPALVPTPVTSPEIVVRPETTASPSATPEPTRSE